MFTDVITNILFPPACVACRARVSHGAVCEACLATIEINPALMCGECHAWIASPASSCHPDYPFILGGASPYENPVLQSLIHHLKFRSISVAAEPLGDLLVRYVEQVKNNSGFDFPAAAAVANFIVMPIPLSRRRWRSRGYNQAEFIARRFADALSLPLDTTTLIRARHAKPQSDITNEAARRENIRGVFAVSDDARSRAAVRDKNIILIDDVSTTGSTFYEASLALKATGAGTIIALAVAKT
jgi:ComF family protein